MVIVWIGPEAVRREKYTTLKVFKIKSRRLVQGTRKVPHRSAIAANRGQIRESTLPSATCSVHRHASPPRTCFILLLSKCIRSHGRCLYARGHVVYGEQAPKNYTHKIVRF